mmetsp:Transcript_17111/g.49115  ORF Transcript_17111/g.49115 Transcript_17111/m.49115 type:complete len:561 (-) Transcript_17111:78-1760(-)
MERNATSEGNTCVNVDVIVPVHNALETIRETVESALYQWIPTRLSSSGGGHAEGGEQSLNCLSTIDIDVAVCCHDDGSTDDSLKILEQIQRELLSLQHTSSDATKTTPHPTPPEGASRRICTRLLIGTNEDGVARGAGYARNRATELRARNADPLSTPTQSSVSYLCMLDSDDIMHPFRIAEQLSAMLSIPEDGNRRERTLMGCTFDRIPAGSTWHYSDWANGLSDERLLLERYREVTLLQPTWFLSRTRFEELGGYVEAPHPKTIESGGGLEGNDVGKDDDLKQKSSKEKSCRRYRLVHARHDTPQTLRLAEDLRFFHEHLRASGRLKLHRTTEPLVTYRHRAGQSQSSSTPRKLLLNLRVMAFEDTILRRTDSRWSASDFVIWGAGRDGKDFFKSLSPDLRSRVRCFVDVDDKKIAAGFYANQDLGVRIPIVHFSLLAKNPEVRQKCIEGDVSFGRIIKGGKKEIPADIHIGGGSKTKDGTTKKRPKDDNCDGGAPNAAKKRKLQHNLGPKDSKKLDVDSLPTLPVVVCVAMYRTNGVLERNVQSIGRVEGVDLWHFS